MHRGAKRRNESMTEHEAIKARELWRFADLKTLGICADRSTLRRWIAVEGFPTAIILSANAVAWRVDEVKAGWPIVLAVPRRSRRASARRRREWQRKGGAALVTLAP
jgi:hypothetical protein